MPSNPRIDRLLKSPSESAGMIASFTYESATQSEI